MSRICVKNLPRYVKEDRLREFFSQKGEVTDAKLMRTIDGKSRQFGFIGFRTDKEAEDALKFFDNTYMDTSRITCEIARKVGDSNIPRPWSRYSTRRNDLLKENYMENPQNSSLSSSKDQTFSSAKTLESSENNDPKLSEFLQIMQPRSKSKLWANDTTSSMDLSEQDGELPDKKAHQGSFKNNKSSMLQTQLSGKTDESEWANITSSRSLIKGYSNSEIYRSPEVAKDDRLSDSDYLKSRIKKNWSDSETDDEDVEDGDHDSGDFHNDKSSPIDGEDSIVKSEDAEKLVSDDQLDAENGPKGNSDIDDMDVNPAPPYNDDKKLVLETGRLFVRNLPYTTNEDELFELFSQFGDVSEVHLVADKDTKRSKGIGYLLYSLPESALRALEALDNSIFQGRLLHVMPARPQSTSNGKVGSEATTTTQEKKSIKQQREEQRKASEASGDTRAWNSLFMRPDTVVENIARKHGVSKSDFLDREADDLAVRIALGETQVVAETKKSLSDAGVNVATLEDFAFKKNNNIKRSNHVILVKNLPYGSSEWDLVNMFGKFGSLDKVILPPTKTLAVVVFLEASEARAAFKGLAYKRYKDVPLYVEWAPDDILCSSTGIGRNETKDAVGEQKLSNAILEQAVGVPEEDIDPDRVESRTIFVKNLNFKTSDESLKEHFGKVIKCGSIRSAKVKKHLKDGKSLSMGFGFIEFDSMETATSVCRDLQGTILDGHALILQLCHAKNDGQAQKKDGKGKSLTKLIVRNVAFEATEKDLRQLFGPFGQIKSLRLPMKLGSHRGFAFVEYVTKQEAQGAFLALSSTHLYGRHLVIERAKEGESLEELRERTAAQFINKHSGFQKLSIKRKQLNIMDEGNVKFSKII